MKGETMASVTGSTMKHRQKQSDHVVTSLYDLIEAVLEEVRCDEQCLVAPVVQKMLRDYSGTQILQ
jgi:hypothetical protein